jgi:hypothetical protein
MMKMMLVHGNPSSVEKMKMDFPVFGHLQHVRDKLGFIGLFALL